MKFPLAPSKILRATVPIAFCVLLFFFALNAKTAGYGGASAGKITPSTASKLWLAGDRIQALPGQPQSVPALWLILVGLFGLYLNGGPFVRSTVPVPSASYLRRWQVHRFLRPPPVQG